MKPLPLSLRAEQSMVGRRVLVTGASRGIAREIAVALASQGAELALHYSSAVDGAGGYRDCIDEVRAEVERDGQPAVVVDCDLSDAGAGVHCVSCAKQGLGNIDSVVLSASVQIERSFLDQSSSDVDVQLQVNIKQNIEILQAVLPDMVRRGFGRVVALGSVQDVAPNSRMPIYSVTKAALRAMIEGLALEYANTGVTLNLLSPGLIETSRNARHRQDPGAWQAIQARANPMGRAGKTADLIPPVLHLLAAESGFVTGSTFYVSGGAHLQSSDQWTQQKTSKKGETYDES